MKDELYNSWFNKLHERRKNALVVFKDPEYVNVFNGVIDKYCDSAHFIYELLQNADDAKATEVEIELTKDKFIFTHNGKIRFTVSDPENAEEDRKKNRLGHINAITAIGFSSKNQTLTDNINDIKIGKFGVGFKAVFQYTTTPYIYDNPFCFKIEDYIVPCKLKETTYQKDGKTVFVIPFDRKDISAQQAYQDIEDKISSLEYPQLFLFNVKTISWNTPTQKGKIRKKKVEQYDTFREITTVLYEINNLSGKTTKILLMSRKVEVPETDHKHTIAIGYMLDDKGRIRTDIRPNMNCFFPTQENIDTCYIIHAPFALVDNRQQIKRKNNVNESLLKSIGQLAADSIVILKDISIKTKKTLLGDNIFALMNYNLDSIQEKPYYSWMSYEPISFIEYYKNIIDEEPVFLSRKKKYITKECGWWADEGMRKLLSTEQLDYLTKCDQNGNVEKDNEEIVYDYILCSLNTRSLDDMNLYDIDIMSDSQLAKKLTTRFIKAQSEVWLSELYKYILDNRLIEKYQLNAGNTSEAPMRYAKIIKNECDDFVAPYEGYELCVFFKTDELKNPESTINSELYEKNEDFRNLIEKLGVQAPSVFDNIRIMLTKDLDQIEHNNLLSTIIRYSNSCDEDEHERLLELISEELKFYCKTTCINKDDEDEEAWHLVDDIIDDSPLLIEYYSLSGLKNKYYIDRAYYDMTIKTVGERKFKSFLSEFDLPSYPLTTYEDTPLKKEEYSQRPEKYYKQTKEVKTLEGLKSVLENIQSATEVKKLSHFIWDSLINGMLNRYNSYEEKNLFTNDRGTYFYYTSRIHIWQTCTLVDWLREYKWLYINNELHSIVDGLYKEDLIQELYTYNDKLLTNLHIETSPNIAERESIKQMSEETQEAFSLGDTAKQLGVSSNDELAELIQRGRAAKQAEEQRKAKIEQRKQEEIEDILPKRKKSEKFSDKDFSEVNNTHKTESSKNKIIKEPVSLEEALAGFEEKANLQREEIETVMTLRETIENSEKYSYGWLQSLMALEVQSNGTESSSGKRSINISFERIIANKEHKNIIVLSGASRYIPRLLEDIDGIPVTFYFRNGDKQAIIFDNASVKEDALIVRGNAAMEPIVQSITNNIPLIRYATLDVDKPIELIKRWNKLIENLPFESAEDSVKNNIRNDLKFIFGPPGTGKTTTLAKRIINLIEQKKQCRILVLTPTNKACDVLTKKILELEPENDYWVWRFVSTMDASLEDEEVVYQRDSEIMRQDQVCVISTMARYSFDGFDDGLLNSLDWDYVIIDEASMIPLYQILPPIFNEHSGEIWIAGDPFQIEPIVNIDIWKEENIYKMIDLSNFVSPQTTPIQFDVELLMTQYRSIPVIGEVYSQYMYGGKLLHDRSGGSHRVLNMGLKESPLNIISFPVTKDSIFDTKRLMGSNIHIYSVLFTVELIKYITAHLSKGCYEEPINIGVLSPYGVEIQSIQKLYNQICITYNNINVNFGTSHGFQGDQCDIVIAVMNPPASGLKRNSEFTFINKPNILNVAVSRAKDYLFVIMPEKEYELFPKLHELKRLGKIMVSTRCNTFYTSDEIEKLMFGKVRHIEDNTFVTSHQTTNIYSDPLAKYEVRIGEQALDIQIHENQQILN